MGKHKSCSCKHGHDHGHGHGHSKGKVKVIKLKPGQKAIVVCKKHGKHGMHKKYSWY
ncbi:hypothetical protein N6H14_14370 [Paenibacillus sp. CC-CFT747]|nr:hypothetical protein N6H14_14370 [Paenibacillus sp. CC-CFT747]